MEDANSKLNPRLKVLAVGIIFGALVLFLWPLVKTQFQQSDTFWLIEIGRRIISTLQLPTHDAYSFTSSEKIWTVYQWLSEVLFGWADLLNGITAVSVLGQAVLAVLFCVLIFRKLLKLQIPATLSFLVIVLTTYCVYPDISSLRPQLFSFLLFWLLSSMCFEKETLPSRKIWLDTFFLGVIWTNCHLSFPIGILLLSARVSAAVLIALKNRSLTNDLSTSVLMLVVFVLSTLVTPFGLSLWSFATSVHTMYFTQEVRPLDSHIQPLLFAFIILTVCSCLYVRKSLGLANGLVLAALLFVGCNCARLIVYFCLYSAPFIALALNKFFAKLYDNKLPVVLFSIDEAIKQTVKAWWYIIFVLAIAVASVLLQPVYIPRTIPIRAVDFISAHSLRGRLFCSAHAGSYLIYALKGAVPVFIDTRIDLYDTEFCKRFLEALGKAVGWRSLFSEYHIDDALVPNDTELEHALIAEPGWTQIYRDNDFSIFERN